MGRWGGEASCRSGAQLETGKEKNESPSQPKAQCLSLKAGGLQADQYRWRLRVHQGTDQTRSDHRLLNTGLLHCQKCPTVRVVLLFPMKHTDFCTYM